MQINPQTNECRVDVINDDMKPRPSLAFKMALPFLLLPKDLCRNSRMLNKLNSLLLSGFENNKRRENIMMPTKKGTSNCGLREKNMSTNLEMNRYIDVYSSRLRDPSVIPNIMINGSIEVNPLEENKFITDLQEELHSHYRIWKIELDRLQKTYRRMIITPDDASVERSRFNYIDGIPGSPLNRVYVDRELVFVNLKDFKAKSLDNIEVTIVTEALNGSYIITEVREESRLKNLIKTFSCKIKLKANSDLKDIGVHLNAKKIMTIEVPFKKSKTKTPSNYSIK